MKIDKYTLMVKSSQALGSDRPVSISHMHFPSGSQSHQNPVSTTK